MVEFLRTSGISHNIEEIIINAKQKLVIISPYLKLTDNLFERLKEKDDEDIEIILVYGKSELNKQEKQKLYSLAHLSIHYYKNLHAKCYYNENKLLITSMNLYEFSEKNNREMGILIDKENDSRIYNDAEQESESIIKASILEKKSILNSSNETEINIPEFEFHETGNISSWIEKVRLLLSKYYPSLEFEILQYAPIIQCNAFISEHVTLTIEPSPRNLRIVFKFNGKTKKDMFYSVKSNGKESFEKIYPEETIGWGNQMMRIKLDFYDDSAPELLKFDKQSIYKTIKNIINGKNIIKRIIVPFE